MDFVSACYSKDIFFFVFFGDYGIQVHHIPVISQISIFTVLKNNVVHTCKKIPLLMVAKSIQKLSSVHSSSVLTVKLYKNFF